MRQNNHTEQQNLSPIQHHQPTPLVPSHSHSESGLVNVIGGLFDLSVNPQGTEPEEEAFRRLMQRKKKKKKRGFRL